MWSGPPHDPSDHRSAVALAIHFSGLTSLLEGKGTVHLNQTYVKYGLMASLKWE
jgi:hypothetical protein